jgi:3-methyladenine DNA glycosylase AlkD
VTPSVQDTLHALKRLASAKAAKSLEYFGVEASHVLGIRLPELRKLAKEIGRNHLLALELWHSKYHEAKLLATLLADPGKFNVEQAETWVHDLYSWDVCDQLCCNLLWKTASAWELPERWAQHEKEYVRRAGIVMIAQLVIHQKKASDSALLKFLPLLKRYATDERNFVKKAVNWSLRELGKRRPALHTPCLELCAELLEMDSKSAHWIARDALRELQKESTLTRLANLKAKDTKKN